MSAGICAITETGDLPSHWMRTRRYAKSTDTSSTKVNDRTIPDCRPVRRFGVPAQRPSSGVTSSLCHNVGVPLQRPISAETLESVTTSDNIHYVNNKQRTTAAIYPPANFGLRVPPPLPLHQVDADPYRLEP